MALIIKKSNTPGALPNVVYGQLAVNVVDKLLWVGNFANQRLLLINTGVINGGLTGQVLTRDTEGNQVWVYPDGGFF